MIKTATCWLILALAAVVFCAAPALAAKRVALLVGNGAYENVPRLRTAVNDARALGGVLRRLGFSVTVAENQSRRSLSEAFLAFDKAIEPGDVALLFFAGHGFEIHGQNFLLPVDVPAAGDGQEELIVDSAFTAERLIGRMQSRGARTTILVLDACRNNPFERPGGRGIAGLGGLAPMTPAEGVFIVFAAGAKQIALDQLSVSEKAQNSLFTRNLLRYLDEPDLTLVQIAKRLQADVRHTAATVGHEQTPAYYDQIIGDVVLNPSQGAAGALPQPGETPLRVATLPPGLARPLLRPGIESPQTEEQADPAVEELQALAAMQSWQELRTKLIAVKPTSRDSRWTGLAEQAAIGELTRLSTSADYFEAGLPLVEHYEATFPSLRSSPKFLELRAAIGLGAYGLCFDRARTGGELSFCYKGLQRLARSEPRSAELARSAGRLVGLRLNRASAAPLFAIAAEENDAGGVCAEPELAKTVIPALWQPTETETVKSGVMLAEKCWDAIGREVVAQVAREGANSAYLRNSCALLMKRNALTGLRAARCREVLSGNPG
jgi:hypothetical protein